MADHLALTRGCRSADHALWSHPKGAEGPQGRQKMGRVEERLQAAGLEVPEVAKPLAAYVPALLSGRDVFTSGQLPTVAGNLELRGRLGA